MSFFKIFLTFVFIFSGSSVFSSPLQGEKKVSSPKKQSRNLKVLVTIKPIHSLICGIMEGVGKPDLFIQDQTSPHVRLIKPSDTEVLEKADVIIWVGAVYETGFKRWVENGQYNKTIIDLSKIDHIHLFPIRWSQGGKGACCHDEEDQDITECSPQVGNDSAHESLSKDGHLWLAPNNAKAIVRYVAKTLSTLDPQHASDYLANSKKVIKRLDELSQEITNVIAPFKNTPYLMAHDFTGYFDRAFGTRGVGSLISASHMDATPGKLRGLHKKIQEDGAKCLIVDPQFKRKMITQFIEDTNIPTVQMDYLGLDLEPGAQCYFDIMRRLANGFVTCFGKNGTR